MTQEKLEEVKRLYKTANADQRYVLESLFPELRESEDERIRKELIEHCKNQVKPYIDTGNECPQIQSWISWLEQQGEKPIINGKEFTASENFGYFEEKSADKVEPKFKVGDWITNGDYTWKIVEVKPLDYILQSQDGNIVDDTISHVDEQFHSFTIKDARDGDVLACKSGWTCIFKTLVDNETFSSYCFMDSTKWFCETGSENHTNTKFMNTYHGEIKLATKEQRAQLFQKMKEAGYEWDADKKELKKIKNVEIPFGAKDSELQEATYFIPKGFHAEIDDDKVVFKKGEKPTAWSEEDETVCVDKSMFPYPKGILMKLYEQLKKL